jgi:hypothetical protein
MVEILFLILSTGGIAAFARGRGGNPWLWGTLSVAGHLLIQFLGGIIIGYYRIPADSDAQLILTVASYAWVGVVAFCTRFVLGSGREKPSGRWSCSNCRYLNQHYAVICEACQQPYGKPKPSP